MDSKKEAAGILPICVSTGRLCLVKRAPNQPQPNTWATFGGSFDLVVDSSTKDTAHREFREETLFGGEYKLSSNPFHINREGDFVYETFLGFFEEEFTPDIEGAGEGQDFTWCDIDSLPDNLISGAEKMFRDKGKLLREIIVFYQKKN